MIVLLQKSTNPADDAMAGERLSTLATKCDIHQKMIFVFPYNDNLMGKLNDNSKIRPILTDFFFRFYIAFGVSIFRASSIILFAIIETSSYAS